MPAPLAATPSRDRGEGTVPVAVSLGALSTKKAKSLDLHVPSLRRRPPGVCGQVMWLGAAPTRLTRARGSDCCGDLLTPALPQDCQPPGTAGTPRAACVWSTSRIRFTPSEGLWGCWPPWSTASSWPEGPGSRPGPGRRRYGCRGSRDGHRPQALPVCSRAPPHSSHKSPCWAGGWGFSTRLSPWLGLPSTPLAGAPLPAVGSDMVLRPVLLRLREPDGGQLLPSSVCPEVAALTWRSLCPGWHPLLPSRQPRQLLQDHVPCLLSDSAPADLTVAPHRVTQGFAKGPRAWVGTTTV